MLRFALENNISELSKVIWYTITNLFHNNTPYDNLMNYAQNGFLLGIKYYLERCWYDPYITDPFGNTLLMISSQYGHLKIV